MNAHTIAAGLDNSQYNFMSRSSQGIFQETENVHLETWSEFD